MNGDRTNSPRKSSGKRFHTRKGGGPVTRGPQGGRSGFRTRVPVDKYADRGVSGKPLEKGRSDVPAPAITSDGQITDGKLLGKHIVHDSIDGSVPVAREVRAQIFRTIGKRVRAARFLDLCAGTGMIGIEAISRGALLASFVERKAKRCSRIRANLARLEIKNGHGEVFEEEIQGFLKRMSARGRFWDVAFYDPPFDADYDDALSRIGNGAALRPGGIVAVRHPSVMFFAENLGVLKRVDVVELSEESFTIFERTA